MKNVRRILISLLIAVMLFGGTMMGGYFLRPANALDIGTILKVGGVLLVVSAFGKDIDKFINKTLDQNEVERVGASKVVPIFSVGQGAYVGAAQVIGVPKQVKLVQAVVAINATLGNLTGTMLVPISTKKPGKKGLDKVNGVGVVGVVDLHLDL
ncbi:MAG: hypothetical protein ACYDCO_07115 [Armatimonadota bacterium]